MTYIYRFWQHLKYPQTLTPILEESGKKGKLTGYKKSVMMVLLSLIVLFALRDIWGMYTSRLTYLYAQAQYDTYIFARYISLAGTVLYSVLYFCFHYYFITYVLSLLTEIPFRWIQKVQLYVIFIFIIEKALEFIIFASAKYTTLYSPFSLAALVSQFTEEKWLLFFVNQFTLGTIIVIALQIMFLRQWIDEGKKALVAKVIFIHLVCAFVIAYLTISPIYDWLLRGLN